MQGFKLVVLSAVLAVSSLVASEVKLKDGKVYDDVTILGRDDQGVEIAVPHGKIRLPLDKVESIDGVAVPQSAKAPEAATPAQPETASTELPVQATTPPYIGAWTAEVRAIGFIILAVVLGSVIWVGIDEEKMRIRGRKLGVDFADRSTLSWAALCFLFWVVSFPLYLIHRYRFIRKCDEANARISRASTSETRKRCPFCAEEILIQAVKCKHCGSLLTVESTVAQETKKQAATSFDEFEKVPLHNQEPEESGTSTFADAPSVVSRRKSQAGMATLLFILALALVAIFCGNVHIITGRQLDWPLVVKKESFGFSETFVKIDTVTEMPWIAAKSRYPLACAVLQREGLIESDEEFEKRMQKEMHEALGGLRK